MNTTKTPAEQFEKLEELFDLKGHVIVVVGGGGKMASHFSRALFRAGAQVVLIDKNPIPSAPQNVEVIECDAADQKNITQAMKRVYENYGRLDSLIVPAASKPEDYFTPFDQYSAKTFNAVVADNLTAAFLASQAALAYMKEGGAIVLFSSTYGNVGPDQRLYENCKPAGNIYNSAQPFYQPPPYSASKAGILGLCRYLATFVGSRGIRVNAISPGGVFDGQEKNFTDEYIKRVPLGRMANWDDYNGAIVFLCSPASRYMTGSNLVVDGGWTAW